MTPLVVLLPPRLGSRRFSRLVLKDPDELPPQLAQVTTLSLRSLDPGTLGLGTVPRLEDVEPALGLADVDLGTVVLHLGGGLGSLWQGDEDLVVGRPWENPPVVEIALVLTRRG